MLKIIIIPKEKCKYSKKSGCYILPKTIHKRSVVGLFKYMSVIKTKKPIISKRMDIYVAGGNGWLTFITLIHECCHYINARFFNANDKLDKWIDKWL